jgi:hypothetical protein
MNGIFMRTFALIMALFGTVELAYADSKESSLDAHVHGLSELTIAMEGDSLEIQFESPAMNLVGFEYKATSNKDIATVRNAESLLSHAENLFVFSDSDCQLIKTSADISALIQEDHHSETHKDHDDHHGHKDHDDHQNHSEIVAYYSYSCKNLSNLSSIKVTLFESFPGIYKINTVWVTDSKQGSSTLTASNPTVTLR